MSSTVYTIRQAEMSDLPYVYRICHKTGHRGSDAEGLVRDPFMLGHYFAAPYIVRDCSWCWIVCERETPVGYLLATPDSAGFYAWLEREWLPPVRKLYGSEVVKTAGEFEKVILRIIHEPPFLPDFALQTFPAHFHIDLMPSAQGNGLGTKLIELCQKKLREEGIPGFYLGVAAGNTGALSFYAKTRLEVIKKDPWVVYLGWHA